MAAPTATTRAAPGPPASHSGATARALATSTQSKPPPRQAAASSARSSGEAGAVRVTGAGTVNRPSAASGPT